MTDNLIAPKVSVIICAYNTAEFLEECLDSVFAQTFTDFEAVIVNDGSTDNTQEIIDRYASLFPAKMVPLIQENCGPSAARNRGLDISRGEYISFVDSDDTISPDFLRLLVEKAFASSAQVISCGFDKVQCDKTIASYKPVDWDVFLGGDQYSLMVVPWARMYRRDFLDAFNLRFYETEFFEDVAFSLSVNFLAREIAGIPFQGYRYRMRKHSTMDNTRKGMISPDRLPFRGIEQAIIKVQACISGTGQMDAFAFACTKALAGILFQVLRHNNRHTIRAMSQFCVRMNDSYFPQIMVNRFISLRRAKGLPLIQRAAMVIYKYAYRLKILYPIAYVVTRI